MTIPHLAADAWQQDLEYFAFQLVTRHKNAYHLVSQSEFARAVADLKQQIPSLYDSAIVVHFQRLAAMIGDGHTRLHVEHLYRRFPFQLFWFGSELRVLVATAPHTAVLGARVKKIGSHGIRAAHRRIQAIIPQGENKWHTLQQSQRWLAYAEPLSALDIIPQTGHAAWTFQTEGGNLVTLDVESVPPQTPLEWHDAVTDKPLYLQNPEDPFWFTYLPDSRIAYLNFRRYHDLRANGTRFYEFLQAHDVNILVIDLRHNGGGDFTQGREYLVYPVRTHSANRTGHLYIITGRGTFSAGMTNATDFRRETDAILIGEPTGARPIGFQETGEFTLPNSGLRGTCSILHYRFQDRDQPAVMPDIRIDPDWNAFRQGLDPVMDWITSQNAI